MCREQEIAKSSDMAAAPLRLLSFDERLTSFLAKLDGGQRHGNSDPAFAGSHGDS